ncbi:MAG: hypothetical protein ACRENB_04660, partial [Gemmatimonadales bacterium]
SELIEPRSMAFDGEGRLYVADAKPPIIKVYDRTGRLVRTIGREGEGPGEFRIAFIAVEGDALIVHDPRVSRTSVFDTSGTFRRSWHSQCCYWGDITVDTAGIVVIAGPGPTPKTIGGDDTEGQAYFRYDTAGRAIDTIPIRTAGTPEPKLWTVSRKSGGQVSAMLSMLVPMAPRRVERPHPHGGFLVAWTGDYSIVRTRTGRDTVRLLRRTWIPDPLSDDQRKALGELAVRQAAGDWGEEEVRKAFRVEEVPTTLPAFAALAVDPGGHVWARRSQADPDAPSRFDVFGPDGAWLGEVKVPVATREYGAQAWGANEVAFAIEDADGRPVIVRYRVVKR